MHSERDYLVKYVFPELGARCAKRGLSLVPIDLRWGVTEEEAEQGKALEICLEEIENCRPYFIGILGERYGWVPDSYQVPDYEKFDWLKDFEKGHSITALEIYQGVLKNKDMKTRAFFYFRNPDFIKDVPQSKQADVNSENDNSHKKLNDLKEKIKSIYNLDTLQGNFTESYCCKYKGLMINWAQVKFDLATTISSEDYKVIEELVVDDNLLDNNEYISLTPIQKHIVDKYGVVSLAGLEEFGSEVLEDLWSAIEQEYPDSDEKLNHLLIENNYHNNFAYKLTKTFQERSEIQTQIENYLLDNNIKKPLILYGETGSGKSAIMAETAKRFANVYEDVFVIQRYVNCTPKSSNIIEIVKNIIETICLQFELKVKDENLNNVEAINSYFYEIIGELKKQDKKILICIDAINQLHPAFEPEKLNWLPMRLPENVFVLISSTKGKLTERAKIFNLPSIEIGELKTEQQKRIITSYLNQYRKTIEDIDLEVLLSKNNASSPLYLTVTAEELRIFSSFELLHNFIKYMPESTSEIFDYVLERHEKDFGFDFVKTTLSIIETGLYGVLEYDLIQMLKEDFKENFTTNKWIKFYYSIAAYLSSAGEGYLKLFHQQFSEAVRNRYFPNFEDEKEFIRKHAHYGFNRIKNNRDDTDFSLVNTGIYLYQIADSKKLEQLIEFILLEENFNASNRMILRELIQYVITNHPIPEEKILQDILTKVYSKEVPFETIKLIYDIGIDFKDSGYSKWAIFLFETVSNICRKFTENGVAGNEIFQLLALSLLEIGLNNTKSGFIDSELKYYKLAHSILDSYIRTNEDNIPFVRYFSFCCCYIGRAYFKIGKAKIAINYFNNAIDKLEILISREPKNTDLKHDLVVAYNDIAQLHLDIMQNEMAMELFNKSIRIIRNIVATNPENQVYLNTLMQSLGHLGDINRSMGNFSKALDYFQESKKINKKLISYKPYNTNHRRNLSVQYNSIGRIFREMKEIEKALMNFKKSLVIIVELLAIEEHRADFLHDLSFSLNHIAHCYFALNQKEDALKYYVESLKIRKKLIAIDPQRIDYKQDLSVSLNYVGKALKDKGDDNEAIKYFEKEIELLNEISHFHKNKKNYESLIRKTQLLADLFYKKGVIIKALEYYNIIINTLNQMILLEPENYDLRRELAMSFKITGKIFANYGNIEKAKGFFTKMQIILEELVLHYSDNIDCRIGCAFSYWYIFSVSIAKEDKLLWLTKAKAILEPLIDEGVTHGQLEELWGMVNGAIDKQEK